MAFTSPRRWLGLMLLTVLPLLSATAHAEQFVEDSQYIAHYSAFTSTHITAETAHTIGLKRSRYRGLINIAVQRKMPDGGVKPVLAQLEGYTGMLGGSEIPLDFLVVEEKNAIYYLAEFLIRDGDELHFDIKIKPTPDATPLRIRFAQEFFAD